MSALEKIAKRLAVLEQRSRRRVLADGRPYAQSLSSGQAAYSTENPFGVAALTGAFPSVAEFFAASFSMRFRVLIGK